MRLPPWAVLASASLAVAGMARAQMTLPTAAPAADGATLALNHCGTCHSFTAGDAPRQGPNLHGVIGRRAGTLPGFAYSAGFAHAKFSWDAAHLDAWLSDPQSVIPSAVMLYRQPDPATRRLIIGWLEEQH
jgi:cytochrome c